MQPTITPWNSSVLAANHAITRATLTAALFGGMGLAMNINGYYGLLQSVQREDGSGKNFNLTLDCPNIGRKTFFVRIID